jgi:bacterioferritin
VRDGSLDKESRLRLIGFACAMAWSDLELHEKERARVLSLMERFDITDPADRKKVIDWLKRPPPVDELDPYAIPRSARQMFVEECEEIMRADGKIHPEETATLTILKKVLFGDMEAARERMAKNSNGGDRQAQIEQMQKILQLELAGVIRYLHYSFMIFGHNRIPIVSFFRGQATEGMQHAVMIGEKITALGGHPTVRVEQPTDPGKHDVRSLLQESLEFERGGLQAYKDLLKLCGDDVALEELTRSQIRAETEHCEEVEKMLREVPK